MRGPALSDPALSDPSARGPATGGQAASGYVTTLPCTRAEADAAMGLDDPFPGIEPTPSLVAHEGDGAWALRLYTDNLPDDRLLDALRRLAPSGDGTSVTTPLPPTDWVALSESGLAPVNVGRFHIFAPGHPGRLAPGQWPLAIQAGLAFGTGRHATTAGCLDVLQALARRRIPHRILDVGTGSGILALAALRLHRKARVVAADLDPRSIAVARANARANGLPPGRGQGRLQFLVAPGVEDCRIHAAGPYDLVFANILAGPLVALAPSLSAVVANGGRLVLAGLLQAQRARVLAAYRARGFRLMSGDPGVEWPVLVLVRTRPTSRRASLRAARRETAGRAWAADSI